jgi:hypothetical protein
MSSGLGYAYVDWTGPVPAPPRRVNGGLYTGEVAKGPWGNYPVVPDPNQLSQNLLSAMPPPNAEKQPTTFNRLGNNYVEYPNYVILDPSQPLIQCLNK